MNNKTLIWVGAIVLIGFVYFVIKNRGSEDVNLSIDQIMSKYGFDRAQAEAYKAGKVYKRK